MIMKPEIFFLNNSIEERNGSFNENNVDFSFSSQINSKRTAREVCPQRARFGIPLSQVAFPQNMIRQQVKPNDKLPKTEIAPAQLINGVNSVVTQF